MSDWKEVKKGESIKDYLKVVAAGTGDYKFTAMCPGLIRKTENGGFEFRPEKGSQKPYVELEGIPFASHWTFEGLILRKFSDGSPMPGIPVSGTIKSEPEGQDPSL